MGVGRSLDDIIGPAYSLDNSEVPKLVRQPERHDESMFLFAHFFIRNIMFASQDTFQLV